MLMVRVKIEFFAQTLSRASVITFTHSSMQRTSSDSPCFLVFDPCVISLLSPKLMELQWFKVWLRWLLCSRAAGFKTSLAPPACLLRVQSAGRAPRHTHTLHRPSTLPCSSAAVLCWALCSSLSADSLTVARLHTRSTFPIHTAPRWVVDPATPLQQQLLLRPLLPPARSEAAARRRRRKRSPQMSSNSIWRICR